MECWAQGIMTQRNEAEKPNFLPLREKKIYVILNELQEENGRWHLLQPRIQWVFKELWISLVRPVAEICSLSGKLNHRPGTFIRFRSLPLNK